MTHHSWNRIDPWVLVIVVAVIAFVSPRGQHPVVAFQTLTPTTTTTRSTLLVSRHASLAPLPDNFFFLQETAVQETTENEEESSLSPLQAALTKVTMMSFIASMCLALPVALLPIYLLQKLQAIDIPKSQRWSLLAGEMCAGGLMKIMPFCEVRVDSDAATETDPQPSLWVANHVSPIDTFLFLALDHELRGPHKRPLKTIYWKGLDENPVLKIFFHMAGFISVDMAANGSGNPNEYDVASFRHLVKQAKLALAQGFDLFVLPEGQLNPTPTQGLLEVYPGAYSLARFSQNQIRMLALHGTHHLWHANEEIGMKVTNRDISIRVFPSLSKPLTSGDEFIQAFEEIVGHFGTTGQELPDATWDKWFEQTVDEKRE